MAVPPLLPYWLGIHLHSAILNKNFIHFFDSRRELFVANAGDSRCVLCRNGKTIEMSFDHKPEDEEESLRITKAGM